MKTITVSMEELKVICSEYKNRFIKYCTNHGMNAEKAKYEYEIFIEDALEWGNPESDASECLSYYNE